MALPRVLKNFNVFYEGYNFLGICESVELPKLTRKMEEYRGGGMNGPVSVDLGIEKLEMTHNYGGFTREVFESFGAVKVGSVLLRFSGACQREDTEEVDRVEIVCRGRHSEIDAGTAKAGEKNEFKVVSQLSYYRLSINQDTLVEIDLENFVEKVGGSDRLAKQRDALGI
ncbi:MAG: phage major tail tube protein [Candidatus Accumulibacter sp.]|jgi:P2 family phage contractile tail tube protein|nr:phage major tail tube protein [Accumulibacter sp.]